MLRPLAALAIALFCVGGAGPGYAYPDGTLGFPCTGCHPARVPSTPTLFVATDNLTNLVRLTWSETTPTWRTGYEVFRSTGAVFPDGTPLATIDTGYPNLTTSFTMDDDTAAPGVTYNYWVRGINAGYDGATATDTGLRPLPPVLSCSPASLSRTITAGNAAADLSFSCSNTGGGSLSYTITDDQSWISVSPTSGSGGSHTVSFPGASSLAPGTYNGTISINGGVAGNDTVAVTLTVQAAPVLTCNPASLSRTITVGNAAADLSFSCSNTGGGSLSYTITDDQSWISVAPTSGSGGTHTVSFPGASSLAPGTYNGTITINGGAAGNDAVAVTLTVQAAPVLTCNPASLSRTITVGNAAADLSFSCSNTGGGALSYTIGDDQSWISVAPTSGSGTTHTVSFPGASSLAPGTYNGTITINGGAAGNDAVAVTLTVEAAPALSCTPASVSRTITVGEAAVDASVGCSNTGGGSLSYTITDDQSWISVSPTSGSGGSHTVSFPGASSLAVGSYGGTIAIDGGAAGSQTVEVTLTVQPPPAIACTPASLARTITAGDTPAGAAFDCTNEGAGSVSYSVAVDQGWLEVSPTGASGLGGGATQDHAVSFAGASLLAPGNYEAAITVDAGAAGSESIVVTLTVEEAPSLACAPEELSQTIFLGDPASSQVFSCTNEGGGSLDYTASDDQDWIGVGPTNVTGLDPDTTQLHTVSYPGAPSLPLGVHTGTIAVTGAGDAGSDSVGVTLTVVEGASLRCADAVKVFRPVGDATPALLTCTNTGVGQDLAYAIAELPDAPWLEVSPPEEGGLPPSVSRQHLLVPALGLGEGVYQTTLRVDGGAAGLQEVPVEFRIPEPGAALAGIASLGALAAVARRRRRRPAGTC